VLVAVFAPVAVFALVAALVDEVGLLVVLEEWPEPPQAAMSSEASMVAQSACRGIGAL
jgi:hypothetical protein